MSISIIKHVSVADAWKLWDGCESQNRHSTDESTNYFVGTFIGGLLKPIEAVDASMDSDQALDSVVVVRGTAADRVSIRTGKHL